MALNIEQGATSHSAYDLRSHMSDVVETHTLAILVENEPGVLARVIGLFSGRGYNIESLTVAEVDHVGGLSRITVVTTGTPQVIEQIKAQLARLAVITGRALSRGAVDAALETRVAQAARTALGQHQAGGGGRNLTEQFVGIRVTDDGAEWHWDFDILAARPTAIGLLAVFAIGRPIATVEAEIRQRIQSAVRDGVDAATVAAIAAIGAAERNEFFAPEGHMPRPAVPSLDTNGGFVYKLHGAVVSIKKGPVAGAFSMRSESLATRDQACTMFTTVRPRRGRNSTLPSALANRV
mgnify:CR=1 FL=1